MTASRAGSWAAVAVGTLAFALGLGLGGVVNPWMSIGLAAGLTLLAIALTGRARRAVWRRPRARHLLVGLGSGLVMVALTHALYWVAVAQVPDLATQVGNLYARIHAPPGPFRALPVLALSVCAEELLWRGVLVSELLRRRSPSVVLPLAVLFSTLPHLVLGTWLVLALAAVCGLVWTWQRLAFASLGVPLVTHLIWSLSIFALLPLEAP